MTDQNKLRICIMISCMHQENMEIISRTNVQTDVVVVNQCNSNSIHHFTFKNKNGEECYATFINTTERGLSKSRNMAIQHSSGDILVVCDDDEILEDNISDIINDAYFKLPDATVIAFSLRSKNSKRKYSLKASKLNFINILKTCSVQLTFKKENLINSKILFDEKMGSGTGNGGGEENKILLDLWRNKHKLYYYPSIIATINNNESQWFHGYNETYFCNLGWVARRLHGSFISLIYIVYFLATHYHLYATDISIIKALKQMIIGWKSKR